MNYAAANNIIAKKSKFLKLPHDLITQCAVAKLMPDCLFPNVTIHKRSIEEVQLEALNHHQQGFLASLTENNALLEIVNINRHEHLEIYNLLDKFMRERHVCLTRGPVQCMN